MENSNKENVTLLELEQKIAEVKKDYAEYYGKNNVAAGIRLRNKMRDIGHYTKKIIKKAKQSEAGIRKAKKEAKSK